MMEFKCEQFGTVGIFTFSGDLTSCDEDNLKLILMKAIHSIDRAVLNLKNVTWMDTKCLELIKQAYFTSVRMGNPLILTDVPQSYLSYITKTKTDIDIVVNGYTDDKEKPAYK